MISSVLALSILLATTGSIARSESLTRRTPLGVWQGTLQGLLRIVIHVDRAPSGRLTGTMDSPDQGAMGLPIDVVTFSGDSLRLEIHRIRGRYVGTMNAGGSEIRGHWQQGGATLPLDLKRLEKAPEIRRPQEPTKPYPYREDTVRVDHRQAGVSLAGTLTIPSAPGPFACMVLISGSGPEDRDETVFGHRPFLVLADHLTRHGIAVLRMDDRGVGASSGHHSAATTEDLAKDVLAAVEFLKSRPGVDRKRIGLIGHSEGGIIAPMVASRSNDVAFMVLLAAPGLPGDSVLSKQAELVLRAAGIDEATIVSEQALQESLITAVRQSPDSATAAMHARRLITNRLAQLPEEQRKAFGDPNRLADSNLQTLRSPWMQFFLGYDPRPALRRVSCPVLVLNGEKDVQVSSKENLHAIENALRAGGNRDVVVKELPGLNHLFQTAKNGGIAEYAQIEETVAPAALEEITRWLTARMPPKR